MKHVLALAIMAALAGCDGGDDPISLPKDVAQPDSEVVQFDSGTVETTGISDQSSEKLQQFELMETRVPEAFVECEPGQGCFHDPCQTNGDCQSGWCVEHMGEGVCTVACSEECPAGWTCQQLAESKPDVVYICVSHHSNLCKPCASSAECKSVGGAEDVCVAYAGEGSFCGGQCEASQDCPWGFLCLDATTVDGIMTTQCVAEAGVCPCTGKSVALGLWSPCANENEHGTCHGMRVCLDTGLSDCDAEVPQPETCNGLDDNCDDDVDEAQFVEGEYVNLCEDGNDCTKDSCKGQDGCQHEDLTDVECVDGDSCTVGDHCADGVCVGSPVVCDDDNPCTDDLCDGLGGCKVEFNYAECDDDDPCTVADQCSQGECSGYQVECECQVDADCAFLDDGNACNGELLCDTGNLPHKCFVEQGSVVECPEPAVGPDAICQKTHCEPESGECSVVPDHQGFACDDGDACTVGDMCSEGECTSGASLNCADDNPCTDNSCDSQLGCVVANNDVACSDGDVCTTNDACQAGECVGGITLVCDDDDVCNGTETCQSAVGCVPGQPLACDDGNNCNGVETCDPELGCQPAVAFVCNDGNICTDDSCDSEVGCVHLPNDAVCDDGNLCTLGDHCGQGKCSYESLADCQDDNPCTTDGCDPEVGCFHNLNEAPCNDDDVCTIGDHCHLGGCISSGELTCEDGNPCTDDTCNPMSGCEFVANDDLCDDGNTCTAGDQCSGAVCAPGPILQCDDENPCTDDFCDILQGCIHVDNDAVCNDLDACTANEFCADGVCGGGVPINCVDENLCTDDGCDPETGCTHDFNNVACSDLNACTVGDACQDGACAAGEELACDDVNVCTDDSCDTGAGCTYDPVADDTPCGNEKHCVAGNCVDVCNSGPGSQEFSHTGGAVAYDVPDCVESVVIEAWGAQGGTTNGGKGARMKGTFAVSPGETLTVAVGGQGDSDHCGGYPSTAGGGGGSFVWRESAPALPMIAAGGGGGGNVNWPGTCVMGIDGQTGPDGTPGNGGHAQGGKDGNGGAGNAPSGTGSGGGGWKTKGQDSAYGGGCTGGSPYPSLAGGKGGSSHGPGGDGGFGGGGGCVCGGGGGGGYSGGGGGEGSGCRAGGGGGGSFNAGTNPDNTAGVRTGHGLVKISW